MSIACENIFSAPPPGKVRDNSGKFRYNGKNIPGRHAPPAEAEMDQIASFQVNHSLLGPGIYVSRRDGGEKNPVTTFDLRVTRPNREPAMDMAAVHTIEHLGATYLRNSPRKDEVIYFGPMGCRTGFYLVMFGRLDSESILPLIRETFAFVASFEGEIPGARPAECGNYREHNLTNAQYYARMYLRALEHPCLVYPD
uniref:S-ribosylhomocysteine lyase n=1 Tax=uncultured bacterium Ad_144_C12_contig1 TaxID=1489308 RepID=A0A0B4N0M0_9BACT|nr:putative LuxS protein [uncultured bacterium Ad_144_C12_contig1]